MTQNDRRPWFGPKRVGYGLRPQTWQGWTLMLAAAAVIVVVFTVFVH